MKLRGYTKRTVQKKSVLMRIDANLPIKNGRIVKGGDRRLQAVVPEIKRLSNLGVKLVLTTHLGRPEGRRVPALSTKPIARHLSRLIEKRVRHVESVVGDDVEKAIDEMQNGDILFLENLRFEPGEEKNAAKFAKQLAKMTDIYVNNAFGSCHRKHASVFAIGRYTKVFAGDELRREVSELSKPMKKPAVLIMGGIKLDTKLPVITHLAPAVDAVLTAGAPAVAMIGAERSKRVAAGAKDLSDREARMAKRVLRAHKEKIHLPIDFRISTKKKYNRLKVRHVEDISAKDRLFDIGPESVKHYKELLKGAKTVIWNGPLGYIERAPSAKSTEEVARYIANLKKARTVVGGGDTVAFLDKKNMTRKFSFVSTGGGAMLAFYAGKKLPGLEIVRSK